MKRFKEHIDESLAQEKVHHEPSIAALKSLAKNNRYHTARFTIDHDDKMKAGDSFHHTHQTIEPAYQHVKHRGMVIHHEGKYHYRLYGKYDNLSADHPRMRHFEKHGIKNGNNTDGSAHEPA